MKLKELLKVIDYMCDVQILAYHGINAKMIGEEEVLFEGSVSDVPWTYADWALDNDSGDGEAVFTFINEKGEAIIGIYVVEE